MKLEDVRIGDWIFLAGSGLRRVVIKIDPDDTYYPVYVGRELVDDNGRWLHADDLEHARKVEAVFASPHKTAESIRDEILSIRNELKEAALKEKELVSKLAEMGFKLIDDTAGAPSNQKKIEHWYDLKVGDELLCIEHYDDNGGEIEEGTKLTVAEVERRDYQGVYVADVRLDDGMNVWISKDLMHCFERIVE